MPRPYNNNKPQNSKPNSKQENQNHTAMNGSSTMGNCTLCGRQSAGVCQRCRDFYCSPECQRLDWPRHRYICFPMPPLVSTSIYGNDASIPEAIPRQFMPIPAASMQQLPLPLPLPLMQQMSFMPQMQPRQLENNTKENKIPQQFQRHQHQRNNADDNISVASSAVGSSIKRTPVSNAVPPAAKMPKANSLVMITGFHSMNRCYVRSLDPKDDADYQSVLSKVDAYGKKAPAMTGRLNINSYAMTFKDGIWYRVQIIATQGAFKVLFLDLGLTSRRTLKELRQISDEIIGLQQYAYIVQLYNVPNYQRTDLAFAQLRDFECKQYRIEYVEDDTIGICAKLINWCTEKLLNEEIAEICQNAVIYNKNPKSSAPKVSNNSSNNLNATTSSAAASDEICKNATIQNVASQVSNNSTNNLNKTTASTTASDAAKPSNKLIEKSVNNKSVTSDDDEGEPQSKQEITVASVHPMPTHGGRGPPKQIQGPVLNPPFKMQSLQIGSSNVSVFVLDDSCLEYGYIGVMPKHALQNFNEIHEFLRNHMDKIQPQPYTPKVEEFCLAKYKDEWYRAKVIEITDDGQYIVVYIDFSNEGTVTSDEIRRYPRSLTNDCYSNLCLIHGVPDVLSKDELLALKKIFGIRKEIIIDHVKGIDDSIVYIEYRKVFEIFASPKSPKVQ